MIMQNLINRNPFKNKKKLMYGAFGDIYLTKYNKKTYIVKRIKNNMYFDSEYQVSKFIKSDSRLCKCLSKYKHNDYTYLLFPYYEKGDLYEHIKNNPIDEFKLKHYIYQMLFSIKQLNDIGFVHCDIKLENFLVENDNKLVLTDFGSVKKITDSDKHLWSLDRKVGTKMYLPPEFTLDFYNQKSDIWSLGVCFYNVITNNVLYEDVIEYEYDTYILQSDKLKIDKNILSHSGQFLLRRMLQISPNNRISVESALNDKWFDNIRDDYIEIYIAENEVEL